MERKYKSKKWFIERIGKQIKNIHPYQGTLTIIDSNHAEMLYTNQVYKNYRYDVIENITDKEYSKVVKALYPKDNSKKFSR